MDSSRLTPLAMTVLEKRYLRKNAQGVVIETPDEMFWRVARDIAEAEQLYTNPSSIDELSETFHGLMVSLDFLPNSPCLMKAGKELQQLAACFVLPIEDSLERNAKGLRSIAAEANPVKSSHAEQDKSVKNPSSMTNGE